MQAPDVDQLLRALGGPEALRTIDAYCDRGPAVIAELFAALLAPLPPILDRNGRAVFEDEELCLHRLATRHPEAFLAQLDAHPKLADQGAVVSALVHIPGPVAEQRLLAALKRPGGWNRWIALRGLLRRGCAAVLPHLPRLLRDRDSTVSFTALEGLRRWGRGEHVPALLKYVEKAAPGGVNFGLDAIEVICAREGRPLPPEHPGPRLESVAVAGDAVDLHVVVASCVAVDDLLAHVDARAVRSPCAGVVSAIDHDPPHLRVTIRREPASP